MKCRTKYSYLKEAAADMNDKRLEDMAAVNTGLEMAFYLEISKVVTSSCVSAEKKYRWVYHNMM